VTIEQKQRAVSVTIVPEAGQLSFQSPPTDGSQPGLSGPDTTLATILRRGYFWVGSTAYTVYQIVLVMYF
jgi:hypothetical protein